MPTDSDLKLLKRIARTVIALQVGKLTINGREHLQELDRRSTSSPQSPVLFICNHTSWADPAVIPIVIDRPARYLVACGVMHFCKGMFASLLSRLYGAIPVEILPNQGGPAREAAVEALTAGDTMVIFPEGWAYQDGKPGPFKKGVVRIVQESAKRLGRPVVVVPVFIRYGRYPGTWIRKIGPPLEYFFLFFGALYYRQAALAVIGKPFGTDEMPTDTDQAVEFLRNSIFNLSDTAAKAAN